MVSLEQVPTPQEDFNFPAHNRDEALQARLDAPSDKFYSGPLLDERYKNQPRAIKLAKLSGKDRALGTEIYNRLGYIPQEIWDELTKSNNN